MSERQLRAVYVIPPRDEHGYLIVKPVMIGRPMGPKEMFEYICFLNSVRDPEEVARLWEVEKEKSPEQRRRR